MGVLEEYIDKFRDRKKKFSLTWNLACSCRRIKEKAREHQYLSKCLDMVDDKTNPDALNLINNRLIELNDDFIVNSMYM